MAARVSQMMIQQIMQNLKTMSEDLNMSISQLHELQYKYLALKDYLKVDSSSLEEIANTLRLEDFNSAATKADQEEKLQESSIVSQESTITITSTAKDEKGEDRGIFRSRIKLSESGVPDLITNLTGKKVGDTVQVSLNGLEHTVKLLSIRDSNPSLQEVSNSGTTQ